MGGHDPVGALDLRAPGRHVLGVLRRIQLVEVRVRRARPAVQRGQLLTAVLLRDPTPFHLGHVPHQTEQGQLRDGAASHRLIGRQALQLPLQRLPMKRQPAHDHLALAERTGRHRPGHR